MAHDSFIVTIVISLFFAYTGGLVARLLRLPNIVGYLLAGVLLGPNTPGFIANQQLTAELADIGIALLMFKIGLHFSVRDLTAVWYIAVPGAALQITASTVVGTVAGLALGWPLAASIVLGFAIGISSTAVATTALEERRQLSTEVGRLALGWLVMQDLVVIAGLVLLPVVAGGAADPLTFALMLAKTLVLIVTFSVVLFIAGRWLLPTLLGFTARIGSHELFTLGVVVIALGVSFGLAELLGISLALGAFFAGLVLGESELSHQAAAESLPIQNIFTVLFFVSVGMLFNPKLIFTAGMEMAVVFLAITVAGSFIFFGLMLALRVPPKTAGATAGVMAQAGEFSFVLTGLAVTHSLMTRDQQGLLLAAAILSILLHPLTVRACRGLGRGADLLMASSWKRGIPIAIAPNGTGGLSALRGHAIVVGYGRVGSLVAAALRQAGQLFAVVEGEWRTSKAGREAGNMMIFGDATQSAVLEAAHPEEARVIVVALPDVFQSRRVIELARVANPEIFVVARVHSEEEYAYLNELGVGLIIMGEREIALSMSDYTLQQMGLDATAAQALIDMLRLHATGDGRDGKATGEGSGGETDT